MSEELPAIIQHAVIGGIGGPLVEVVRLEAHQRIVAAQESKLSAVQAGADRLAEALKVCEQDRVRLYGDGQTLKDVISNQVDDALAAYSETKP